MLRISNHHRTGTAASPVRRLENAESATGWTSSANAQQALTDASSTKAIRAFGLRLARKKFLNLDPPGPPSEASNGVHRLVDLRLLQIDFGNNAGDRAPVPRNDHGLAPFYFVE
jgi:hypothetical protein